MGKPIDGGRVLRRQTGFLPKNTFDLKQMAELYLEHCSKGGCLISFSAWLIHSKKWEVTKVPTRDTVLYWVKHHPEFKAVYELGQTISLGVETITLDKAKRGEIKNYQFLPHKFKMMNIHGWGDRVEQKIEGGATGLRGEFLEKVFADPKLAQMAEEFGEALIAKEIEFIKDKKGDIKNGED